MRRRSARYIAGRVGLYLTVSAFSALLAFPFYWMFLATFKTDRDLYDLKNNPLIFNDHLTLANLKLLFERTLYTTWLWNTFVVGVTVVGITLLLALPAGYALARLAGRWGEPLGIGIFLTYLVPSTLLFIPLSRIVALLGLQDSLWSLVVVYPSFTIPFCVWLLMGFFKSIPKEIEEAAMVDGCSRARAIVQIIMPISLAGILSAVIFAFTLTIQEFVYALTFITSSGEQTVSVGVPTNLVRGDVFFWGSLMAGCLITSIPVAILYNLFLDRFIAGFTVGAIK
ncbi:MAG TPA: carbohydrate ABC transporter permease [Methylomirabilota bacterium]